MTVVVFNPTTFKARYPEFSAVSDALLGECFNEAGLYLNNTNCSIVKDTVKRAMLLNMLTAHIAFLGGALSVDNQTKPVGRLSSATEGSVSASFEYLAPGSSAWFTQTQYGANFWQATVSLRGFRYFPRPTRY